MLVLIEKNGEFKKVQPEDLDFFVKRQGWKVSDKKEVPVTAPKKGKKRTAETAESED